jgi:uncharacterized membrane protein
MRNRLIAFWNQLSDSYWFIPALMLAKGDHHVIIHLLRALAQVYAGLTASAPRRAARDYTGQVWEESRESVGEQYAQQAVDDCYQAVLKAVRD